MTNGGMQRGIYGRAESPYSAYRLGECLRLRGLHGLERRDDHHVRCVRPGRALRTEGRVP